MPAQQTILDLVQRFDAHATDYRSADYKEAELRQEFINPFFQCLGWDMTNEAGHAESYKDVVHEDALKIDGNTKAPDYSFRIGGTRKFFLEAKKPAVGLARNADPAYQLRRYAWSAKLPVSILTNFAEFAVYECRKRPDQHDKASVGRIHYFTHADYAEKWDEIAAIFSKDAILKGSFDKFADATRGKRGTAAVDEEFLAEIEEWRVQLARNIALRNPKLSQRELNFAVQVTIDRIIFLRICEDRGIEHYGELQRLLDHDEVYKDFLVPCFERADVKYNSGLFHFDAEKGRDNPDTLTPKLLIDDKVLKDIIKGLYFPLSPYAFSVITADILGQVYEQFLGKVIRLTAGHKAKVDDKPEVKKAGGVYYTPSYIVEYIVQQTVGKLLNEPEATTKNAAKLRILDPACGSGSFLLGAYEYLLNWHRDRYIAAGPENHKKELTRTPKGEYRLKTSERKRILLNNIYGVDIDPQAVEVTKLSLLLKVLEGETLESSLLSKERLLPDLDNNIRCGNSLIGTDYYKDNPDLLNNAEEVLRINAFDWQKAFPAIMKAGGFDAVVGNPPYGANVGEIETKYFRSNYECPANSLDTFLLFVERSSSLLVSGGYLGVIIPSGWVSTPSAKPLRELFLGLYRPRSFVSLPFDVFADAYIDTVILTAQKKGKGMPSQDDEVDLIVFPHRHRVTNQAEFQQRSVKASTAPWSKNKHSVFLITCTNSEAALINKIDSQKGCVDDYVLVKRGIETFNPVLKKAGLVSSVRAFNTDGVLQRYTIDLGTPAYLSYPADLQQSKPPRYFKDQRILLRQVLSRKLRLQGVLVHDEFLTSQSVQSLIPKQVEQPTSLHYILAVLNSKLLSWYFRTVNSVARRDDFPKIIIQQTRELPVPPLDFAITADKARHDALVSLVTRMLSLHEQRAAAKIAQQAEAIQAQIEATDKDIDRLVYDLYGLTAAEIRIVENATAGSSPEHDVEVLSQPE